MIVRELAEMFGPGLVFEDGNVFEATVWEPRVGPADRLPRLSWSVSWDAGWRTDDVDDGGNELGDWQTGGNGTGATLRQALTAADPPAAAVEAIRAAYDVERGTRK